MTDDLQSAIRTLSEVLAVRTPVYVTSSAPQISAAASFISPGAGIDPLLAHVIAGLCTYMALDPNAFFEAAGLLCQDLRAQVARLRQDCLLPLLDSPQGILRWSPSSGSTQTQVSTADLEALRARVRSVRFSRSEISEQTKTTLVSLAQHSAHGLAAQRRDPSLLPAAATPVDALLLFQTRLSRLTQELARTQDLQEVFASTDFGQVVLRRMLEAFDVDISDDISALATSTDPADRDSSLAHLALFTQILQLLLSPPVLWGELLAPQVNLTPTAPPRLDVWLRPIPQVVKGAFAFAGRITVSGASHRLECGVRQDGQWSHPTWFEQRVTVRSLTSGGWSVLGPLQAKARVLLTSQTARLRRQDPPAADPAFLTAYAVEDVLTPTDWSAQYAALTFPPYQVLIIEPLAPPQIGVYHLLFDPSGPAQGYRLMVDSVGAPVSFPNVAGSYLPLELSDPLGDLPTTVALYFQALAAANTSGMSLVEVGSFVSLDLGVDLTHVDDASDAFFEVLAPYDGYFGGAWAGIQDKALGVISGRTALLDTAWDPASPYGLDGMGADTTIYTPAGATTDVFVLDVAWSPDLKQSMAETFLRARVRAVDLAGVEDPVELSVLRCYILAQDYTPTDASLAQAGDLVLELSEGLVSTGSWQLQLQDGLRGQVQSTTAQVTVTSPWQGFSDLPLDLAPGDELYFDDGGKAVVWGTSGSSAVLVPPQTLSTPRQARRVRHLRRGDFVLGLTDTPDEGHLWRISSVGFSGIDLEPLSDFSQALANGTHHATPLVITPQATTTRFEVLSSPDLLPVELEELASEMLLAWDVETPVQGQVVPSSLYVVFGGRRWPVVQVAPTVIELSRSTAVQLPALPQPAWFVLPDANDGHQAELVLEEQFVSPEGDPLGAFPAGGGRVYDLLSGHTNTCEAFVLPATEGQSEDVRTRYVLRGRLQGPLVSASATLFAPWALLRYRIERMTMWDLTELFADLGRAKAQLGADPQTVSGQEGLDCTLDSDRRGGVIELASALVASRVEGCDVVFSAGAQSDPPVRVKTASVLGTTATVTFSRQVPVANSGTVTLREHSIASAYRELRGLLSKLEELDLWLSYVRIPPHGRIRTSAASLRLLGFAPQAKIVDDLDLARWPGLLGSSPGADLRARVDGLVELLSRTRTAPLDEGG